MIIVTTGPHSVKSKYYQTDYESACASTTFRVRFGYDGKENGRVGHLLIDGRPVPDAAEILQIRAARRLITGIEILDCRGDPRRPIFQGMINFSPGESRMLGMWRSLAFRLIRKGNGWRMIVDEPAGHYEAETADAAGGQAATLTSGMASTDLPMLAEQGGGSSAKTGPKYHRNDFESACGGSVFRARFRNGPTGRSRVEHVQIDGRPIPGAAKRLDRFAARREIDRVEIMNCGMDPLRPVFRGVIGLSKPESQPYSKENLLFFRLVQHGKGWRISVD